MTISSDPTWPATGPLVPSHSPWGPLVPSPSPWGGPHCLVVVQEVGQVVLDEIFARHSQIHWIPISELTPQLPGWRKGQSSPRLKSSPPRYPLTGATRLECHMTMVGDLPPETQSPKPPWSSVQAFSKHTKSQTHTPPPGTHPPPPTTPHPVPTPGQATGLT